MGTPARLSPSRTGPGSPSPPQYLIREDKAQHAGRQLQEEDDGQADGELREKERSGEGTAGGTPRRPHPSAALTVCSRQMFSLKEPTQPQKVMRKVRTPTMTRRMAGSTARHAIAASATASCHQRCRHPRHPTCQPPAWVPAARGSPRAHLRASAAARTPPRPPAPWRSSAEQDMGCDPHPRCHHLHPTPTSPPAASVSPCHGVFTSVPTSRKATSVPTSQKVTRQPCSSMGGWTQGRGGLSEARNFLKNTIANTEITRKKRKKKQRPQKH